MADKENKRKCFKCGRSPASDNVKLFRFPKPAIRNHLKCAAWATFVFPEDQRVASSDFQRKLYNEHRMLCNHHFSDEDYTDITKTRLQITAFPHDDENNLHHMQEQADPAQPSVSQESTSHTMPPAASSSQTWPPQTERLRLADITNVPVNSYDKASFPSKSTQTLENPARLLKKCTMHMQSICSLQNRIKALKREAVLNVLSEDKAVKKLSQKLTPAFALLLQGQLRNCKKKKTGRRWSKEEKLTSLRIYKRSPTCYRLLRRMFCLPSIGTLKAELNKVPFDVGINKQIFEVLKKHCKISDPSDNVYTLMFDEMSLKKHLNYNIKTDKVEGFQDHGAQGRAPLVAGYALVFMIAGVRKRVKQPIAHYFSSGFSTSDRLVALIKEVLYECFQAGIHIAAIVCDMDGVNRRAMNILGASADHPYIMVHDKEIITLFDTPHLLKCFRNLWIKYDIEYSADISSDNRTGRGIAKWSHIKEFFELDSSNPNFVYAPSLKKEHLEPNSKQKMKVNLAAQVLSHSVAGGIFAKVSKGDLSADAVLTGDICSNMDKLFDLMNADSSDLKRGKPCSTNMRKNSPHLQHMEKMKNFFLHMKFVGCTRKPPSQEGWVWSINAMVRLWRYLTREHGVTSLATRRVQQDALENLFGVIRGNCGSNTNPTTAQFAAGLKTAILTNLAHIGTSSGNCETDNNEIINNFSIFLSVSQTPRSRAEEPAMVTIEKDNFNEIANGIDESMQQADGEVQACAYVCGFLIKRLGTDCDSCKSALVAEKPELIHEFVESREYRDEKRSLLYATKDMIRCVENCATLTNTFLKKNSHLSNLKAKVTAMIKEMPVNFSFLDTCRVHKKDNMAQIINSVFAICIKRYCILQNRSFSEEASAASLKRKMKIILHK